MPTKTKAKPKPLEEYRVDWIATEGSILVPAVDAIVITLGIELKSQGSGWSHNHRAAYGRSKRLREHVCKALMPVLERSVYSHFQASPRTVSFTRLAPRTLDDDNLRTAFKPIRDQVCAWLAGNNVPNARANDSLRSGYTFSYHQQQQRAYGVRIELAP